MDRSLARCAAGARVGEHAPLHSIVLSDLDANDSRLQDARQVDRDSHRRPPPRSILALVPLRAGKRWIRLLPRNRRRPPRELIDAPVGAGQQADLELPPLPAHVCTRRAIVVELLLLQQGLVPTTMRVS
jgi:hypothetical protein